MARSITLGICAMEEKIKSSAMQYLIEKLKIFKDIEIIIFGREILFLEPIERWPICDCFLSFFSIGFPLDKVIEYSELRNPFLINDLKMQKVLQDRRKVYQILKSNGISSPKNVFLLRDKQTNEPLSKFIECEDYIEINGERIYKPFIEKPFDSDDHNNFIYYPKSQGGGCRKLFRKIGNESSFYFKDINNIRTTGSYIYEEFVQIDESKDVKVYSTPNFQYAELRKSPSVDGYVERGCCGKEKRSVAVLTQQESEISNSINKAFKQFICGFDVLRVNGKSYVCDVNGWSLVKGDHREYFYNNTSKLLYELIKSRFSSPDISNNSSSSSSSSATTTTTTTTTTTVVPLLKNISMSTNNQPEDECSGGGSGITISPIPSTSTSPGRAYNILSFHSLNSSGNSVVRDGGSQFQPQYEISN
eukprot:gene931-1175_t